MKQLFFIGKLVKLISNKKVQSIFIGAFTELSKEEDVLNFIKDIKEMINKKKEEQNKKK